MSVPDRTPQTAHPSLDFWTAVVDRAEEALAQGAMHSFDCAFEFIEDGGVEFVMRVATRFPRGETAAGRGADAPKLRDDPFGDPEPELVVGDLTATHRAMLNKFSVVREHLLVVTKEFVDQRTLLGEGDFEALALCMKDAEVLAFYNGGREAGASQSHKHIQVVTLPLSPRHSVPMAALLERDPARFPVPHAFTRLAEGDLARPPVMLRAYRDLYERAGLRAEAREGREWQSQPYNLLITHEWMLLVPRSRDRFEGISINSLAFAGSFFVRDTAQLSLIAQAKPMNVLKSVAMP